MSIPTKNAANSPSSATSSTSTTATKGTRKLSKALPPKKTKSCRKSYAVVSILNKNNDEISIGIDINTHLPINRRYTWRDPDKYKVEDETLYGNYRTVQGIATPFTITNKRDGEINGQNFLTHVEYNTTFEPDFFNAAVTYNPETYNPKAKKK